MRTRFVAEIWSNHQGELERALALVDAAQGTGCWGVKLTPTDVRRVYSEEALQARPELAAVRNLSTRDLAEVCERAREKGLCTALSACHPDEVARLAALADVFVIDDHQLLWAELLRGVASSKKPVVLSTAMASMEEVRSAVELLRSSSSAQPTLLHGVAARPAPAEECNLAAIESLRRTFGGAVGWSDHSRDPEVIERAARRFDAALIEFRLDLDGRGPEYAGRHCWLPGEIAWAIRNLASSLPVALRHSHPADGDGRKEPRSIEEAERRWRADPSDGRRPLLAMRQVLARQGAA